MKEPILAYEYGKGLYLNITNECPTSCVFCIKRKWKMSYRGNYLKLAARKPSFNEIIAQIRQKSSQKKFEEIVFCGYGEPTERFDIVKQIACYIREGKIENLPRDIKIRINTNGLGNLINGYDITRQMKGLINSLHVSLNSHNRENWKKLMRPLAKYEKDGFESVVDFIISARSFVDEVVISAVEGLEPDIEGLKKFAEELDLPLRLRQKLEDEN